MRSRKRAPSLRFLVKQALLRDSAEQLGKNAPALPAATATTGSSDPA
jgi:hypothetical protein